MPLDRPRILGILNCTPDSFHDGGHHNLPAAAVAHGLRMLDAGADLIDLMRRLNEEEDVTFVFSTHDPRLLDRVDRIVRLEDGRVVDDGNDTGDPPGSGATP